MDGHVRNEEIQLAAKANYKANFGHVFSPTNEEAMVDHASEKSDFVNLFFQEP